MKSDYIERESCRNFFGLLDRVDYFSATSQIQVDSAWRKGERFFTRDVITSTINYILELEADRRRFTQLEAAVMAHPDAASIYSGLNPITTCRVAKNGKLQQGDELSKTELAARRATFK